MPSGLGLQSRKGVVSSGHNAIQYDQYPESPLIAPSQGRDSHLADAVNKPGQLDFGRNGSYLVFRQMAQGVKQFWQSKDNFTKDSDGTGNAEEMVVLASKLIPS